MAVQPKLLIGFSGSVASIKARELVELCSEFAEIRVVLTQAASHFITQDDMSRIRERALVYTDEGEWEAWKKRGDPVVHIELRKWADAFLIAPLSANTMAKLANGLCDNLLTCVARAWDFSRPFLVAPAMNTLMWQHPLTSMHLQQLQRLNITVIPPVSKTLICGDSGVGAMSDVPTIFLTIRHALSQYLISPFASSRMSASSESCSSSSSSAVNVWDKVQGSLLLTSVVVSAALIISAAFSSRR